MAQRKLWDMTIEEAAKGDVGFKRSRMVRHILNMRHNYLLKNRQKITNRPKQSWKALWQNMISVVEAWIGNEREEDDEVVVCRRSFKMFVLGAVKYREKSLSRKAGGSRGSSKMNLSRNFLLEEEVPAVTDMRGLRKFVTAMISVGNYITQAHLIATRILPFDHNRQLIDTRVYDLYNVLCEEWGEVDLIPGESRACKFFSPMWDWQTYYGKIMFSVEPASRVEVVPLSGDDFAPFKPSALLQLLRLYVDSKAMKIFGATSKTTRKRKRGNRGEGSSSSGNVSNMEGSAYAIECVVNAWTMFVHCMGFRTLSEFMAPFIVLRRRNVSLRVVRTQRCLPSSGNVHLEVVRLDLNDEIERDVGQSGTVDQTMEHVGVGLFDEQVPPIVKELRINKPVLMFWRRCVADFVSDIEEISQSKSIYVGSINDAKRAAELEPYIMTAEGGLPPRFVYERSEREMFRNAVNSSMIRVGHSALSDEYSSAFENDSGSSSSDDEVRSVDEGETAIVEEDLQRSTAKKSVAGVDFGSDHYCESDCDCDALRELIEVDVLKYPTLLHCHFEKLSSQLLKHDPSIPSLEGRVQFILTDPPYNVRRLGGKPNSDYDVMDESDMKRVVVTCANLLRPGGHAILFCSMTQFEKWTTTFRGYSEKGNNIFLVTGAPLLIVPKPKKHGRSMKKLILTHTNIVEYAVHVVKRKSKEMTIKDACRMVDWTNKGYTNSIYSPLNNIIDGNVHRTKGETMYETTLTGRRMIRAEQKSVALCQELVERYSRSNDIVVDLFAGTGSTAVACITVKEVREFYGCDLDEKVVAGGKKGYQMRSFIAT